MTSLAPGPKRARIVVGVDTHNHMHAAVAVDELGSRLGECHVRANREGYAQLEAWAVSLGRPMAFGVEGTGSYGVGLASWLRRNGYRLVEVNRGDRRSRRMNAKTDALDAEAAARSVLSGESTAVPKSADGTVEMIRQIKIARDTARKGPTSAIVTLKAVTVPAELREQLEGMADKALIGRCSGLRPGPMTTPTASAKHTLRSLAKRWIALNAEIEDHDPILDEPARAHSPNLRDGFGIGADTAAEMLIVFGDNPDRIRSEAAFAKLCGACPIPASSGVTNRHRLSRGRAPTSQRRALPRRHRAHALPPAHHRLHPPTHHRRPLQKRHHPLPQTIPRPRGPPTRHDRPPRTTRLPTHPMKQSLDL